MRYDIEYSILSSVATLTLLVKKAHLESRNIVNMRDQWKVTREWRRSLGLYTSRCGIVGAKAVPGV